MTDFTHWHVGMEVVFVGTDDMIVTAGVELSQGDVFTIHEMHFVVKGDAVRASNGKLYRVHTDTLYIKTGGRLWYNAKAFRPVQKRKTDISIFTSMLDKPKVENERELEKHGAPMQREAM